MKKLKIATKVFFFTTAYLMVSCSGGTSLQGKWYGLRDRSLVTVTLLADQTIEVESEASSNMSFSGKYRLNETPQFTHIDLTESTNGMEGAGLIRINKDGTIEMNIEFGASGEVQRPKTINPLPTSMTNVYFKLLRDKNSLLKRIPTKVKAPESAHLAFKRNARLGAGINLNAVVDGNLHPGFERDAPLDDSEIKRIADVGFNSVRLNVCWAKHCLDKEPYTIDNDFFRKVDHIVQVCLQHGLAVSIDQHYYPYINMGKGNERISEAENYERLYALWEQIAEHYKNYDNEMLFFDLLNEPNMAMGADKWNEVLQHLIKIIRKTNPQRSLIIATPSLGQSWTLGLLEMPDDDWNLIVEFHYYLPHLFTHQGLAYAQAEGSTYVEWKGTTEEKAMIEHDLDFCKRWSEKHARPLNMGEYGCMNTADISSRARYLGFMRKAAEERGFSSHLWGYREPFMISNPETGEWIMPIIEALKLKGE